MVEREEKMGKERRGKLSKWIDWRCEMKSSLCWLVDGLSEIEVCWFEWAWIDRRCLMAIVCQRRKGIKGMKRWAHSLDLFTS